MLTSERAPDPVLAPPQYAVVLVDEEQLDQLMRRPSMRRVNSGFGPRDVYARYDRLKRRTTAAAVFLFVLVAGGAFWFLAPEPAMASMFAWTNGPAAPVMETGASFSVAAASLSSGDAARGVASRIRGTGLAAYMRRSPGRSVAYQALAGPYASLDEAEAAQRRLAGLGYSRARIFVDETLRDAGGSAGPDRLPEDPGVVLLGAPDRLSLVLELPAAPRYLSSRRTVGSMLEIDVGPVDTPVRARQWSAPGGVHLLGGVALESLTAPTGGRFLRARVSLPEFAGANVRREGRRIYVDLTWPLAEDDLPAPRIRAVATAPEPVATAAPALVRTDAQPGGGGDAEQRYHEAMDPVRLRIREIRPFLLSAAQSGSFEVFAALDQTLADLEATLAATSVPPARAGEHQLLVAATRAAREGVAPGFDGDRLAKAYQAVALFEGAVAGAPEP